MWISHWAENAGHKRARVDDVQFAIPCHSAAIQARPAFCQLPLRRILWDHLAQFAAGREAQQPCRRLRARHPPTVVFGDDEVVAHKCEATPLAQ